MGRIEKKTLYDLSEVNPDTGKIMKKPVPVLKAYDLGGRDYAEMFDFVSGPNDYVDYEEMLETSENSKNNALFEDGVAEFGVSKFLPRMEDGIRKLDDKANIKLTKEFAVAEGYCGHWTYRVVAKTPAKHDNANLS